MSPRVHLEKSGCACRVSSSSAAGSSATNQAWRIPIELDGGFPAARDFLDGVDKIGASRLALQAVRESLDDLVA